MATDADVGRIAGAGEHSVSAIEVLRDELDSATSCIYHERKALQTFVMHVGTRTVISNSEPPTDGPLTAPSNKSSYGPGELNPQDQTDHATATAFTLSRIIKDRLARPTDDLVIATVDNLDQVIDSAIGDFLLLYGDSAPPELDKEATREFPNAYHTPIHLASLAAIVRLRSSKKESVDSIIAVGDHVAGIIAEWFRLDVRLRGLVPHENGPQSPIATDVAVQQLAFGQGNAYLTFLAISSLVRWLDAREDRCAPEVREAVQEALSVAFAVATLDLSRHLASFDSGLESLFDAVEVICTLAVVSMLSIKLDRVDEFTRATVHAALRLIAGNFLLRDGSFAPKPAAFTTRDRRSVVISTAELADILLEGAGPYLSAEDLSLLSRVVEGVVRKSKGVRGWGADSSGSNTRKPSFVTSASLSFLSRFADAARIAIAIRASRELDARPHGPDDFLKEYKFPLNVREALNQHVIRPLTNGQRDLAAMSLVLEGPPGTSKTTIAKKIAYELRWPLVVLEQGSFLRRGATQIEAEAERIFELLNQLTDTVVLLDEIEEMVGDREDPGSQQSSRFLTTSMLPRIHTLRDAGQIVFIIATNFLDRLDPAAVRPGRVDRIFRVDPPTKDERSEILTSFANEYKAPPQVSGFLSSEECLNATDEFTVGYLRDVVRTLVIEIEEVENRAAMLAKVAEIGKRVNKERLRDSGKNNASQRSGSHA